MSDTSREGPWMLPLPPSRALNCAMQQSPPVFCTPPFAYMPHMQPPLMMVMHGPGAEMLMQQQQQQYNFRAPYPPPPPPPPLPPSSQRMLAKPRPARFGAPRQQRQVQDPLPPAVVDGTDAKLCAPDGAHLAIDATCATGPPKRAARYKTELCRAFLETGICKYGDKCQFAHGGPELRRVPRHPKFKSEMCRTFHSTGFCPYGPRCHFIHTVEDMPDPEAAATRTPNAASTVPSNSTPVLPVLAAATGLELSAVRTMEGAAVPAESVVDTADGLHATTNAPGAGAARSMAVLSVNGAGSCLSDKWPAPGTAPSTATATAPSAARRDPVSPAAPVSARSTAVAFTIQAPPVVPAPGFWPSALLAAVVDEAGLGLGPATAIVTARAPVAPAAPAAPAAPTAPAPSEGGGGDPDAGGAPRLPVFDWLAANVVTRHAPVSGSGSSHPNPRSA